VVRVEESILVERPAGEVFEYLTDPARVPDWLVNVVFMSLDTPGGLRQGARLTEVRRLLGREMQNTIEVVEHDPPHRFATRVLTGPVPHEITNTLTEVDGCTRMDRLVVGDPGAFFGIPEERAAGAVRRQIWNGLATLKDILEGRSE